MRPMFAAGYDITAPQNQFLQEMFKGTNRTGAPTTILLYRPTASGSAQATVTTGVLTATAVYPGARGNDISIVITELTEPASSFTVSTVVDGAVVDQQTAAQVSDLEPNSWVTWSGTGALTATTGAALTGGQDGTVESAASLTLWFMTGPIPQSRPRCCPSSSGSTTTTGSIASWWPLA